LVGATCSDDQLPTEIARRPAVDRRRVHWLADVSPIPAGLAIFVMLGTLTEVFYLNCSVSTRSAA
jgi:hypothetical protein